MAAASAVRARGAVRPAEPGAAAGRARPPGGRPGRRTWPPPPSTTRGTGAILDQIRVRDRGYAAEPGAALDEIASDFRARRGAPDGEPVPGRRGVGRRLRDARPASAAGPGDPQAGGAAPRPPAAAPAARPGRRRAVRAQAVLGDVPADGQPGAAAAPAVRRRDLRRGQPDRARRRDPVDHARRTRSSWPGTTGSCRRPASSARSDRRATPATTTTRTRSLVSFGAGFESVLDVLSPLLPTCAAGLALPQPGRAAGSRSPTTTSTAAR